MRRLRLAFVLLYVRGFFFVCCIGMVVNQYRMMRSVMMDATAANSNTIATTAATATASSPSSASSSSTKRKSNKKKGKWNKRIQDSQEEEDDDESSWICIANGTMTGTKSVALASPYHRDWLKFQPAGHGNTSLCQQVVDWDGKTHIFISVKHGTQYGHLLLNGMAPLWNVLQQRRAQQQRNEPPTGNESPVVLHYFTEDERYLNAPYLPIYLNLLGLDEIQILHTSQIPKVHLFLPRNKAIVGLAQAELDHYNPDASAELWKAFRQFLYKGILGNSTSSQQVVASTTTTTPIRVVFVQRQAKHRVITNLDPIVESMKQVLTTQLGNFHYGNNGDLALKKTKQKKRKKLFTVKVVSFERLTLLEQAQLMSQTDILIGADGTNLVNGLYMPMDTSCIVSILPYGVSQYLPDKGKNFQDLFTKLGTKYVTVDSLPTSKSQELVERAATKERIMERRFLLKQPIQVPNPPMEEAMKECIEYVQSSRHSRVLGA